MLVLAAGCCSALGQDLAVVDEQAIGASPAMPGALFGISVAMGDGVAVVGASDDSGTVMNGGAVYVFEKIGGLWSQSARIESDDLMMSDFVGYDVALDEADGGATLVAGAWGSDTKGNFAGAAYVFERDLGGAGAWGQRAKLVAPDGRASDVFGISVAVSDGVAAVGASLADAGGVVDRGAVYLYERDVATGDWVFAQKLVAPDANTDGQFGFSVAMDNGRLIVGSIGSNEQGNGSGAAYLYQRQVSNGLWTLVTKLTGSDVDQSDQFGHSVAIDDGRIVVGARRRNRDGLFAGAAFVFEENFGGAGVWGETATFRAGSAVNLQEFGQSVSVHGDLIAVGAIGTPIDGADDAGTVHFFRVDAGGVWNEELVISADADSNGSGGGGTLFGSDVAVRLGGSVEGIDWTSVVGARGAGGDSAPFTGAGRVVELGLDVPAACPADLAPPEGVLNFFDISAYIGLFNSGDAAADFAAPFGVLNFFDLSAFIGLFNAGCP